jgi:molybdopterin-guanine dinucleotide biosynthesis protein A
MGTRSDIAGAILAGGRSSRFGSDKTVHLFQGTPMAQIVFEVVSSEVSETWLVISADSRRPSWTESVVVDRVPDLGPMGGIDTAFETTSAEWLLVVAADLPYLTGRSVRLVCEGRGDGTQAVIARDSQKRIQPLCACYHRDTRASLHHCIRSDDLSMNHLISQLKKVRYVTLPDGDLTNVNRPEDLAERDYRQSQLQSPDDTAQ